MNKFVITASTLALGLALAACDPPPVSADRQQQAQQEQISKESNMAVGMPAIVNFTEKKLLKQIIELRDNPKLSTFTFYTDLQGNLHLLCKSVGYGIPYAAQFTNPQRVESRTTVHESVVLPQADPNGLFTPTSAEGTWILCIDKKNNDVKPVYVEPRVIVSPIDLRDNG